MALPKGAELGATNDPKALIVGDKAAVAEQATAILDEQRRIGKLLDTIVGLAIPTWEGGLGKVGYFYKKGQETEKLKAYRDILKSVGTRLNTYADALGNAQDRAQDAIDKWNKGEAATKAALADHNAAVAAHNERVNAYDAKIKTGVPVPPLALVSPGSFIDPGEELREEAQKILADARNQLNEEGGSAVAGTSPFVGASTSASASVDGSGPLSFFDDIKNAFQGGRDLSSGKGEFAGEFMNWKSDSKAGKASMPLGNPEDWSIKAGTAEFNAAVYELQGQFDQEIGELRFNADGSVTVMGASGEAFAKIDKEGLALGAEGHLRLVEVKGAVSVQHGDVEAYGKGSAYVGADGVARFEADKGGVRGDFEGFVGARSAAEVGFKAGGLEIGMTGEAWAGAGAEAEFDMGFDDKGRFVIQGNAGAALESGGALGGNLAVDFDEVRNTAVDAVKDPRKLADLQVTPGEIRDGGKWIYSHREEIGDGAGALGKVAWENRHDIAARAVDGAIHAPAEKIEGAAMLAGAAYENREIIGDKVTVDRDELKSAGSKIANGVKGLFE